MRRLFRPLPIAALGLAMLLGGCVVYDPVPPYRGPYYSGGYGWHHHHHRGYYGW